MCFGTVHMSINSVPLSFPRTEEGGSGSGRTDGNDKAVGTGSALAPSRGCSASPCCARPEAVAAVTEVSLRTALASDEMMDSKLLTFPKLCLAASASVVLSGY